MPQQKKQKQAKAKPLAQKYHSKPERDAYHAKLYKAMISSAPVLAAKAKQSLTKWQGPTQKPGDSAPPYPTYPTSGSQWSGRTDTGRPHRTPRHTVGATGPSGRRAPGYATSLMTKQRGGSGGSRSSNNKLDASAGAAATVTAVVAPWTAYRNNLTPGVPDGSVNETKRYWNSNSGTFTSTNNTLDTASCLRLQFSPNLVDHIVEYKTWSVDNPTQANYFNATEYAALAAQGVLFYRVVAMGVQVKNITEEAQLEGATTLTQVTNSMNQFNTSNAALTGYNPGYTGASNKPGVIMQGFWVPDADNNGYTVVGAAIPSGTVKSMGQLTFSTTVTPNAPQIWFYQTFLLIECLGDGDALNKITPYIGDPTVFAEGMGNELASLPQWCMRRNFKADDVIETAVGSGIEMLEDKIPGAEFVRRAIADIFDVDVAKEAAKWAKNGIKKAASAAGSWFSNLWGATAITPTEFKMAGLFASMDDYNLDILQELSAQYPEPGELRTWANGVLGTKLEWEKGHFTDSPYLRGEIKDPGPCPPKISRIQKLACQDESKHELEHRKRAVEHDNIAVETTISRRNAVIEPASPALSFISVQSSRTQPPKR